MQDKLSTAQKLLQDTEKKKDDELIKQEKLDEWRDCLNRMSETPDGEEFFKKMIKFLRLYESVDNPNTLFGLNERRKFYLKHVRPYLNRETLQRLEYYK